MKVNRSRNWARIARLCRVVPLAGLIMVGSSGFKPRATMGNSVSISVSGEADVVLVDPYGRRDIDRNGTIVSSFPGCYRTADIGTTSVDSDEPRTTMTVFALSGSAAGTYRLEVRAREATEVFVTL